MSYRGYTDGMSGLKELNTPEYNCSAYPYDKKIPITLKVCKGKIKVVHQ